MEELLKIIEGFKRAEEACGELFDRATSPSNKGYWLGHANAFQEVVRVLEKFMVDYSTFAVKVWEIQEKWDKGVQRLVEDLEKERGN